MITKQTQRQARKEELKTQFDRDREALAKVLVEEKRKEQGSTLSVLDALRRSRKARGGTGAPLTVPANLQDAAAGQGILITDADLNPTT